MTLLKTVGAREVTMRPASTFAPMLQCFYCECYWRIVYFEERNLFESWLEYMDQITHDDGGMPGLSSSLLLIMQAAGSLADSMSVSRLIPIVYIARTSYFDNLFRCGLHARQ